MQKLAINCAITITFKKPDTSNSYPVAPLSLLHDFIRDHYSFVYIYEGHLLKGARFGPLWTLVTISPHQRLGLLYSIPFRDVCIRAL